MKSRWKSTAVLAVAAAVLDNALYGLLISPYALRHWWPPHDLKAVELLAAMLLAAVTSLAIGYLGRIWWSAIPVHAIGFGLPLVALGFPAMQGFVLPVGVAAAGLFGWVGASVGRIDDFVRGATAITPVPHDGPTT